MTGLEVNIRAIVAEAVRDVVREELAAARRETRSAEYLTFREAAAELAVSASTIKRWVRLGRLKTFGAGRLRRVRSADVRALLAEPAAAPTPEAEAPAARATAILATLPRRSRR